MIKESEFEQVILDVLKDGDTHKSAEIGNIIGVSPGRIDRAIMRMNNGRGDIMLTPDGVRLKTAEELAGNAEVISDSFKMVEPKVDEKEVDAITSLGLTPVTRLGPGPFISNIETGQVVLFRKTEKQKDRIQVKAHIIFLTPLLLDGVDYVELMIGKDGWAIRQLQGVRPASGLKYKVLRHTYVSTIFCKRISDSIIERLELNGDNIEIVFKNQPIEKAPNIIYLPFKTHEVKE